MEFTFLVLAAAGGCLLWQRRPQKEAALQARDGRGEIRFAYLLLSLFLTVSAFLGWWATQVLYDQQVIYSYKALSADSTKDPTK
jgi:heme A synthase